VSNWSNTRYSLILYSGVSSLSILFTHHTRAVFIPGDGEPCGIINSRLGSLGQNGLGLLTEAGALNCTIVCKLIGRLKWQ